MADITLLGANYPDVPAVVLPRSGGGTATFYEDELIHTYTASIATTDWSGSGPYTYTVSSSAITADSMAIIGLQEGSPALLGADIEWETAAGSLTLSTTEKPSGTLNLNITTVEER